MNNNVKENMAYAKKYHYKVLVYKCNACDNVIEVETDLDHYDLNCLYCNKKMILIK
ncbi:hypothetical protein LCGC14_2538160 [marine sediment metagenome]|uniref:Uncharacterized protein n=1 Tax=marine sediment metagenome TaxID=412755 RepID=A0A0F9DJM2_9ZZZZ